MRNISSDIFLDEVVAKDHVTLIVWIGLIVSIADDQGRMIDNPAFIRALLFPYSPKITQKHIDNVLTYLHQKHKIVRYHAGTNGNGRKLIQIITWWKYQKKSSWASASQYPAPERWIDRVRMHVKGNQIHEMNWDKEGGYLATTKALHSRDRSYPLPSREVKDEVKVKDKEEGGVDKKTPLLSNGGRKNKGKSAPLPAGFAGIQKAVKNGK